MDEEEWFSVEGMGGFCTRMVEDNEYLIVSYACSRCGGYDKRYTLWDDKDKIIVEETLDPSDVASVLCYECSGKQRNACVKRDYIHYRKPSEDD